MRKPASTSPGVRRGTLEAASPARRAFALICVLGYAALVYNGSSGPAPDVIRDLEVSDVLLHAAEYAVLGFLLARLLLHMTLRTGVGILVLVPVAIGTLYGLSDEVHQSFVPGRDASALDVVADGAGTLLGALLYRTLLVRHLQRAQAVVAAGAALLLFAVVATGAPDDARTRAADTITLEDLRAHAELLASPELRGRNSPSPDLDLAARYIAGRFKRAGLEPAAADGGWFQPVPMAFRKDTGRSFFRLLARDGRVSFSGRDIGLLRESPDGEGGGPLVFAGYGMVLPELGRDDYDGLDVRGKVVVVLTGYPGMRDRASLFRRGRGRDLVAQRSLRGKAGVAARRGAVALVAVAGPLRRTVDRLRLADGRVLEGGLEKVSGGYRLARSGFRRRTLDPAEIDRIRLKDGTELLPRTGRGARPVEVVASGEVVFIRLDEVERVEEDVVPLPRGDLGSGFRRDGKRPEGPIPILLVSDRAATALLAGTGHDLPILEEALQRGPMPFAIEGRAAVVRVETDLDVKTARNVLGRMAGREDLPGTVVVTAHYDHVGTGAGGVVFHGADDNASGTATMLEVADALGQPGARPRRPVLFAAFAAEEKGLVGSAALVKDPTVPLDDILAVLNLDMMGRGVGDEVFVNLAPLGTDLLEVLKAGAGAARLRPVYRSVEPVEGKVPPAKGRAGLNLKIPRSPGGYFGRSDHANFYRKGIPCAFFFGGMHSDYNRPTDTWDRLNLEKMKRVGRFVFFAAHRLAEDGIGSAPAGTEK